MNGNLSPNTEAWSSKSTIMYKVFLSYDSSASYSFCDTNLCFIPSLPWDSISVILSSNSLVSLWISSIVSPISFNSSKLISDIISNWLWTEFKSSSISSNLESTF
jgi:hypothetical protein